GKFIPLEASTSSITSNRRRSCSQFFSIACTTLRSGTENCVSALICPEFTPWSLSIGDANGALVGRKPSCSALACSPGDCKKWRNIIAAAFLDDESHLPCKTAKG